MLPKFEHLLKELLSINSISAFDPDWDTGNRRVVEQLANWLKPLGFHCEFQALPNTTDKLNLVATLGQGDGGLVLSGHTDTVPYDQKGWQYDPFNATLKDDKYYGLGSCDMKGFFAVVLDTLRDLPLDKIQQPLIILATADEETSMAGAELLAAAGKLKGRAAIVGEPTDLSPKIKHKSITMQRISIHGQSGHSSNPDLGNSALEAMNSVIARLIDYRNAMQQQFNDAAFEVRFPTMNFGCIHGGDSANRICGSCHSDFDLRLLPGMKNQTVLNDIGEILERSSRDFGVQITLSPLFKGVDPFQQAQDSELVQLVTSLTQKEAGSVAFGTEAPYLKQLGFETVVLGPGSIDQAHQPNEYLALESIEPTKQMLRDVIKHYCYAP